MAEDARISTSLPAHPKTRKLRRRLGTEGCWSFVVLILWTANERFDGALSGLSDEDIELAADWDGQAGEFVKALTELRMLDGEEWSRSIHDWADHQPYVAKRPERVKQARKAADARWGKERETACSTDADSKQAAAGQHAESMQRASGQQDGSMPPPATPATPSENKPSSSAVPTTPSNSGSGKGQELLAKITDNAIAAFNAQLGKPNGLLASVSHKVGRRRRQIQVNRCLRTARQICQQQFEHSNVTPEFWAAYFAEVDRNPFKSGRQEPGRGHENWKPTFEYLTRDPVMIEVFDAAISEAE